MDLFQSLEKKLRQLRGDESGSVLLLSGMMSFLIAIMAMYAVDTSQVVYNRITSQNASDAAAMTAALWQARGLNLEQELNDFHYFFNESIFVSEAANLVQCATAVGPAAATPAACTVGDILGPEICEGDCDSLQSDCNACESALTDNQNQSSVAQSILGLQSTLSTMFPLMELEFASDAAQESGADPVLSVIPDYVGGAMSSILGSSLSSLSSAFSSLGSSISSVTSGLPSSFQLYAAPISSISLNVESKGGGYWPWTWDFISPNDFENGAWQTAIPIMWAIEQVACSAGMTPCLEVGDTPIILPPAGDDPSSWTWSDNYYIGHPGSMTWVAGKTNETELAGLGNLRWLNPQSSTPAEVGYTMGQTNLPWYTGSYQISSGTTGLQIPAVIGLATSQVEGTGVVAVDENLLHEVITDFSDFNGLSSLGSAAETAVGFVPLDSTPRLTSVYINGSSGTTYFIYH